MRRFNRLALVLLGLAALAMTAGCYSRTVGAKGFGADRTTIEDPDNPDYERARKPTPLRRKGKYITPDQ